MTANYKACAKHARALILNCGWNKYLNACHSPPLVSINRIGSEILRKSGTFHYQCLCINAHATMNYLLLIVLLQAKFSLCRFFFRGFLLLPSKLMEKKLSEEWGKDC